MAEKTFDLAEGLSGYRMKVKDERGFQNDPMPRRALRLVPEDPPQVSLLRDSFGEGGTFDVEGMPVPLGKKIRIPYVCFGAYGLGKASRCFTASSRTTRAARNRPKKSRG